MISSFEGKNPKISDLAYVAPGVVIVGDVELKDESSVWFQSVLRGDINSIVVGEKSNIQDACVLHVTNKQPLIIGDRVTVGHGAILHACRIGDDCLIAMGAIVLDGAVVEPGCIIGAGALVPPGMVVKSGSLLLGSPGRVVRKLGKDDEERIKHGWTNYIDYSRRFRAEISNTEKS